MTPEQELLLACASPYPAEEQKEKIHRLLQLPLNWPEITTMANKHGISQLLFHTIQQIDQAAMPEAVKQRLHCHFNQAVRRNLFLTGQLLRIIKLLAEQDITAVPFKGPVLAEKLYSNLPLRVFGDLDILVHRKDANKAKSLLIEDGFFLQHHPDSAHQLIKANATANIVLEVHWEAISIGSNWLRKLRDKPMPTTLAHLSPRLQEIKLGGRTIPTLSPEDTLLILTIHGSKHWWSRLNWLADIAALIHVYPELDWDWVMAQIDQWKIRRLVLLGLHLANESLAVPLPDKIHRQITAEPALKKLANIPQSMFFVEQNLQTRYIKRPAYFRQLWDSPDERRTLYIDHIYLYLKLFTKIFKHQPKSKE